MEDNTKIQARFSPDEFDRLDRWRRAQPKILPLSEVVKALVFRGLTLEEKRQTAK